MNTYQHNFLNAKLSQNQQQIGYINNYNQEASIDFITNKLRSKQISIQKLKPIKNKNHSDSPQKLFNNPSAQKLMKQRFNKHIKQLKNQINYIGQNSQPFGGIDHLYNQLSKNKMTLQQKQQYQNQHRKKIFSLPQLNKPKKTINLEKQKDISSRVIKNQIIQPIQFQRSKSVFNSKEILEKKSRILSLHGLKDSKIDLKPKVEIQHNKWYIKPDQRFKIDKKKTIYDWNKNNFYLNIVRTRGLVIQDPHISELINATRQKIGREPVFCKYSQIKINKRKEK